MVALVKGLQRRVDGAITYLTNQIGEGSLRRTLNAASGGESPVSFETWLPRGFEFLSGLPDRQRRERLIVVVQAFIDDSGSKNDGPLMVVSALVGAADVWAEVSDAWERELGFRAEGRIAYFKEDEAVHLDGEFRHWREAARDVKVARLSRIVNRPDLFSVWYGLDLDAHRAASRFSGKPLGDVKRHAGNQPYLLLMPLVMMGAAAVARDKFPRATRLELILDQHDVFMHDINTAYPGMRAAIAAHPVSKAMGVENILPAYPMFRDDLDFLPLQAADMVAGTVRRVFLKDPRGLRSVDVSSVLAWPQSRIIDGNDMVRFAQAFTPERLISARAPRPERKSTAKKR